jgi:hypothetical protein
MNFSVLIERNSDVALPRVPGTPYVLAHSRGMVDAPNSGMPSHATNLRLPTRDGRVATFSYALSDTQGWDVRAQIDGELLTRHCNDWGSVERLYAWIRSAQRPPYSRSAAHVFARPGMMRGFASAECI